jgi:hypothetical protein
MEARMTLEQNGETVGAVTQALMSSGAPMPGLLDVRMVDGREYTDLTPAQIVMLAARLGLKIKPAS